MASKADIQTGTILKIDPQLKAGYIVRDGDGAYVYFTFQDVAKNIGLGVARENQAVQFIQEQDPASGKLVARQVAVMPGKR